MTTLSTVILTANRRDLLAQTLECLARGTRVPDQVVVVNNHTEDDTVDFLQKASFPFELVVVDGPEQGGFAEGRAVGVQAARGDLVSFIDDDCLADRFCLERLVSTMEKQGWVATGGSVIPASPLPSPQWYAPEMSWAIGCHSENFSTPLGGRLELPSTSNMMVRREVFEKYSFKGVGEKKGQGQRWSYGQGREDVHFWRDLRRGGEPVGVTPKAIVWHQIPPDRLDKEKIRSRARQDGQSFWHREHLVEEAPHAVKDVVYTLKSVLGGGGKSAVPMAQRWEAGMLWARRQLAFLAAAVRDPSSGYTPAARLWDYIKEGLRLFVSLGKSISRPSLIKMMRALRGEMRPVPTPEKKPRRLLVVLHDMLGDAVLALPLVQQLAEGFPKTEIVLVTGPVAGPLLKGNVGKNVVVKVVPSPARGTGMLAGLRLWGVLRKIKPDGVLIAYCHGLNPGPFFFLGGAPVVAWPEDNGIKNLVWATLLTRKVEKNFKKPEVAALLDLLLPFGVEGRLHRPRVEARKKARHRCEVILEKAGVCPREFIVIHLEGEERDKFWPKERMFALIDWLIEEKHSVFLVGSRQGRILLEKELSVRPGCHSLQGVLNSEELIAFLSKAQLFIGCDSGPGHVAQACGVPSVHLFGMTAEHRWGPMNLKELEGTCSQRVASSSPGNWLVEECRGLEKNHGMTLLGLEKVQGVIREVLRNGENFTGRSERH